MSKNQEVLTSAEDVLRRIRMRLGLEIASQGATYVPLSTDSALALAGEAMASREFSRRSEYVLSDLIAYDDEEFVGNAYRAILLRSPDEHALSYLRELRDGTLTKVEILGELRWSEEGLRHSVHIDGLLLPYKLRQWRRLKILGPGLGWILSVLQLPLLLDRMAVQLGRQAGRSYRLGASMEKANAEFGRRIASLETAFDGQHALLQERVDALASDVVADRAALDQLRNVVPLVQQPAGLGEGSLDELYASFEDQFRGTPEEVKARLEPYCKVVDDVGAGTARAPILDLGCGRGEWLEVLRSRDLVAIGVDLNRVFVADCQKRGLRVEYGDVIEKLRSSPAQSVGLVSMLHLAEHLPFEMLIEVFDQAHRILVPGGGFIVETPNPENSLVAQWGFYMDPTHRNPLPPEMLRWLVSSRGFAQADIMPLFHGRPQSGLPIVGSDVPAYDVINALATSTRAALDYAIVARKSVSSQ